MKPCEHQNKHLARRCQYEDILWYPDARFATCPSCGEATKHGCFDEEPLTRTESLALELSIKQERERELAEAQTVLERRISAGQAAIRFDLDHWAELDPNEWLGDGPVLT